MMWESGEVGERGGRRAGRRERRGGRRDGRESQGGEQEERREIFIKLFNAEVKVIEFHQLSKVTLLMFTNFLLLK